MLSLGHISYSDRVPVHGLLLELGPPPTVELVHGVPGRLAGGSRLAVPTASATSATLIKIIMQQRIGIRPDYFRYEQESSDPAAAGEIEAAPAFLETGST